MGHHNGMRWKRLVQIGDDPDDCWEWLGCINEKTGYGKKQWFGKPVLAHRWVYELIVGPIPEGMVLDHKCSNRSCVNPFHLEAVTQAENCQRGMNAKLSPEQVKEIKAHKEKRKWGDGAMLARKFGVSGALIHDIWNGRAWRDS